MKSTSGWWSPRSKTSAAIRPSGGPILVSAILRRAIDSSRSAIWSSLSTLLIPRTAVASSAVTRSRRLRLGQEVADPRGHREPGQLLPDHVLGQEVGGHELGQRRADGVLAVGDDRGVRDRQPERPPEQGGDREPVGQRTDHARPRPSPARSRATGSRPAAEKAITKMTAISTSAPVATAFIRFSRRRRSWSAGLSAVGAEAAGCGAPSDPVGPPPRPIRLDRRRSGTLRC